MRDHNDPKISNRISPRTNEYIALGPTGNIQGTNKLLYLNAGKVIKRRHIISVILTDQVINKVNDWGKHNMSAV